MTAPTITREFTRTFGGLAVREDAEDAREFTGIGVPYGQIIEHDFGPEVFEPGSVTVERAVLRSNHRDDIGVIVSNEDTPDGHIVTARISDTALGRDAWTLVKDGVFWGLSIGFRVAEDGYRIDEDGTVHFTKVVAREFSLTGVPAYTGATVDPASLRTATQTNPREDNPMTETVTRAELAEVNETLTDLERSVKLLSQCDHHAPTAPAGIRSMGEFLRAIVDGNAEAAEFHRAYTGGVIADAALDATFVGDFIKLVQERRSVANLFSRGTLPADGMSISYRQLKTDTTKVAKQEKEGDNLVGGKVALQRATADVNTYGGWTEMSRQEIERGSGAELDIALTAMALKYAQVTNGVVRDAVLEAITDQTAASPVTVPAASTADSWLDALLDAAELYEARGFALTGLAASKAVFKELLHLKDGDRRVMSVYHDAVSGQTVGRIDVPGGIKGNLAGISVDLLPGVTGSVASFYDPVAVKFLESAGAPAQLQDENIINLTKQFSIYGYAATLVPFPAALVPVKRGAAG